MEIGSQPPEHVNSLKDHLLVGPRRTKLRINLRRRSRIYCCSSCCTQLLWIRQTLRDFGVIADHVSPWLVAMSDSGRVQRSASEVGAKCCEV